MPVDATLSWSEAAYDARELDRERVVATTSEGAIESKSDDVV